MGRRKAADGGNPVDAAAPGKKHGAGKADNDTHANLHVRQQIVFYIFTHF